MYNFKQGDIYFANLNPIKGHEQRGRRPVIIVSSDDFNSITHLVKVVPVTSKVKDFPAHVNLIDGMKTVGQALTQQERTIDLTVRQPERIEHCPDSVMADILELISESYKKS